MLYAQISKADKSEERMLSAVIAGAVLSPVSPVGQQTFHVCIMRSRTQPFFKILI